MKQRQEHNRHIALVVASITGLAANSALFAQPIVERDGSKFAAIVDRLVLTKNDDWRVDTIASPIGKHGEIATPPTNSVDVYTELPDGSLVRGALISFPGNTDADISKKPSRFKIIEHDKEFAIDDQLNSRSRGVSEHTLPCAILVCVPVQYTSDLLPQAKAKRPASDRLAGDIPEINDLVILPVKASSDGWAFDVPKAVVQRSNKTLDIEMATINIHAKRLIQGLPSEVPVVSIGLDGKRDSGIYITNESVAPTRSLDVLVPHAIVAPSTAHSRVVTTLSGVSSDDGVIPTTFHRPFGNHQTIIPLYSPRDRWRLRMQGMNERDRPAISSKSFRSSTWSLTYTGLLPTNWPSTFTGAQYVSFLNTTERVREKLESYFSANTGDIVIDIQFDGALDSSTYASTATF